MPLFRFARLGLFTDNHFRRRRPHSAADSETLECRTLLSTFYVNGDTGSDQNDGSAGAPFRSIQQGVNAASLNEGDDEILVEPTAQRPYSGTVIIDSFAEVPNPPDGNLVIRGATGDAADVLFESFSSKFINNADFDVTIADMTLAGGGHGVVNAGYGTTVVDNLSIQNNNGTGVLIVNGDTVVRDSNITDSHQGIWVGNGNNQGTPTTPNSLTVEDTTLNANRNFGIITRSLTGGVTLTNVTANDNARAGGNFNGYTDLTITGGAFSNNNFNGIFVHPGTDVTLTDIDVDANGTNGVYFNRVRNIVVSGGSFDDNAYAGMEIYQADGVDISDASFSRNGGLSTEGVTEGGGLRISPASPAPINISNVTVTDNDADNRAGGIEIHASDSFNDLFFVTATISDSVVSGHSTPGGSTVGGIRFLGGIHATVSNTLIENNDARFGGGIQFHSSQINGQASTLVVTDSQIRGNNSDFGGGINVSGETNVNVTDSIIHGNSSNRHGGGISYTVRGALPSYSFIVENSTITDNQTFQTGGGVYAFSPSVIQTSISGSTIDGNTAGSSGGGVMVIARNSDPSAALTMTQTTVSNNTGFGDAGGVFVFAEQPVEISSSTISGNSTNGSGVDRAGGIVLDVAEGSIRNVTVSGNSAAQATGGMTLRGGSFFDVTNVTVTENTGLDIGGLFSRVQQNTVLTNTILAGNTRLREPDPQFPFITTDLGGSASSGGGNVIGITVPRLLIGTQSSDQVGTADEPIDAKLGPLQDNGAAMLTHMPALDSPVIDAGISDANTPTTDQRGKARPSRGGIDAGAVERQNSVPEIAASAIAVSVTEGSLAVLGGSASDADADTLTLTASVGSVVLNADGTWDWGFDADDGPVDSDTAVVITATDAFGATASVQFELTVTNVAPDAGVSGPADAVPNQNTEFVFSASDPSSADEAAGFEYRIDWDNDGTVDQVVTGGTSVAVDHSFSTTGLQTVAVVAVDKDGGISDAVTTSVNVIQPVQLTASKSSVNLNSTGGFISLTIWSTAGFDATTVDVGTVIWAGASVSRSKVRDFDGDGLADLELKFRVSETNLVSLYTDALRADRDTTRKSLTIGLTGKTTAGHDLFGEVDLDLFMTGKKLRDLLNSL